VDFQFCYGFFDGFCNLCVGRARASTISDLTEKFSRLGQHLSPKTQFHADASIRSHRGRYEKPDTSEIVDRSIRENVASKPRPKIGEAVRVN
jgi:hypothetical protein